MTTSYLQSDYSTSAYSNFSSTRSIRSQIFIRINRTESYSSQTSQIIQDSVAALSEVRQGTVLHQNLGYGSTFYSIHSYAYNQTQASVRTQVDRQAEKKQSVSSQVDRQAEKKNSVSSQVDRQAEKKNSVSSQTSVMPSVSRSVNSQAARQILAFAKSLKTEVRKGILRHCYPGPGTFYSQQNYLEDGYAAGGVPAYPYAVGAYALGHLKVGMPTQVDRKAEKNQSVRSQASRKILAFDDGILNEVYRQVYFKKLVRTQTVRRIFDSNSVSSQVARQIFASNSVSSQAARRIFFKQPTNSQITFLSAVRKRSQIIRILYNTTNLRVLANFASRGISDGLNWSTNSVSPGDFSVNNLNTDIVEQVWRGSQGVKSGIILTCDSEVSQGIFVDTLAFLGHNLTTSASIVWQASNVSDFSVIGQDIEISSSRNNIYYISPSLPSTAFRYHRFLIDDVTNVNDYLQIGTILFGSSVILQGENFTDQVSKKSVHFSDKIATEGFTNVSNDRALKFAIGLNFENLELSKGNYQAITQLLEFARTSLKCLWIPTPRYASRYAVFGKLTEMPQESHNDLGQGLDFVSFSLTIDESM